jgi:hypothetical protein
MADAQPAKKAVKERVRRASVADRRRRHRTPVSELPKIDSQAVRKLLKKCL